MPANQQVNLTFDGVTMLCAQYIDEDTIKVEDSYNLSHATGVTRTDVLGIGARNPITNQKGQRYPYLDELVFYIQFVDNQQPIAFDLRRVANQPTWTPDLAGLAVAMADIKSWIGIASSGSGAAPPLPAGISTEAKQDAMIAELMKMIDWEIYCVRDSVTGVVYLMDISKNESTGVVTVVYRDAQGNIVVPPNPGDLVVCDSSAILTGMLAELQLQSGILQDIDDNTDGLEAIAASSLTELQAINLNTDGVEALLTAGNVNTAAAVTELQAHTVQFNTIITSLGTINTSIQNADTNNVTELQAIQAQLVTVIASLTAIDGNTAPLEASLTAIEAAINTGNLDLATIATNTGNTVTELITANTTLSGINTKLTGGVQTFNLVTVTTPVALPAGIKVGSVRNQGGANGTVAGAVALPGTTIPIPKADNDDTYGVINVDGTGTSLLIQYTT